MDATATGGEEFGKESLGVDVGGLDEYRVLGVAESGDPSDVLWDVQRGECGEGVGGPVDEGDWEGIVCGMRD